MGTIDATFDSSDLDAIPTLRSTLERFTVADFVQWNREGRLTLNPDFQRRSIWPLDAKSYLIDSMLLGFPIPKVYLRTTVDPKTQVSIRDVVDGQQRLRAILDFSESKLTLNKRSDRFRGMKYDSLPLDLQRAFLNYPISVEHLIDADDYAILEAFSRLNSLTYPLNSAERRHALYPTELKWFVRSLFKDLREFLVHYNIVSSQRMLRMEDDAFFAELVNIVLNGVVDGGGPALNKMYRKFREDFPEADRVRQYVTDGVQWMDEQIFPALKETKLTRPYQVQMIFAAYTYQRHGLPPGRLPELGPLPQRTGVARSDQVVDRLSILAEALELDVEDNPFFEFVNASRATTRFSSRSVRFLAFNDAIRKR